MPTVITRLIAAVTLATLIACSSPPPDNTVTSVTINGGDRSIVLGDALTLAATVAATGTASQAVTWTSSNQSVATIATNGQVSSLTTGTTNITAASTSDPTKSDSITLTITVTTAPPGALRWTRQFGTSSDDRAFGIATDASGHVYAAGYTSGALEGSNAGDSDAFVGSYDGAGNLRWTRQFGTGSSDVARGIATDASGNVTISGDTRGALEGSNVGGVDVFVRSYDSDGNLRWTRQFGTSSEDVARGIATDASGNVYATGYTGGALQGSNAGGTDAFIRSYDSDGNLRWTRQFGTGSSDFARGIASDANGNVYAIGSTSGVLEGGNAGGWDVFVRSYDSDGNLRWTRQFGTSSEDVARGIATDASGNVYATGYTEGALVGSNAGSADVFIRSYDSDGNLRWTRQFGTASGDFASGIATDANGNVYATGETLGTLEGSNAGGWDAFIRSYDSAGDLRWTRQFGTSSYDAALGIATDASGSVYTTGYTRGAIEGSSAGNEDAFIRSYGR